MPPVVGSVNVSSRVEASNTPRLFVSGVSGGVSQYFAASNAVAYKVIATARSGGNTAMSLYEWNIVADYYICAVGTLTHTASNGGAGTPTLSCVSAGDGTHTYNLTFPAGIDANTGSAAIMSYP